MSWVPQPDGSSLCEEHGERFPATMSCPKCGPQHATIEVVEDESEVLEERARAMNLGDELTDERTLDSMRRRLWAWSKAAHDGTPLKMRRGADGERTLDLETPHTEPNHRAAADYAGLAIRAARSKAELTLRRRDWNRYFKAARAALRVKHGTPEAARLRDAIRDAADGREVQN